MTREDDIYSAITCRFDDMDDIPLSHQDDLLDFKNALLGGPLLPHQVTEQSSTSATWNSRPALPPAHPALSAHLFARPISPKSPLPSTPAIKPRQLPDCSPVTPAESRTITATQAPPAPFNLPPAQSFAAPVAPIAAPPTKSSRASSQPTPRRPILRRAPPFRNLNLNIAVSYVSDALHMSVSGRTPKDRLQYVLDHGGKRARNILLAWVTRANVVLPEPYKPSDSVERAFNTASAQFAIETLEKEIKVYVEEMKSFKRRVHKERLRLVEPFLEMTEREAARHRVEAGLTKFKTVQYEKALRAGLHWVAARAVSASTR